MDHCYLGFNNFRNIMASINLETVPVVDITYILNNDIDSIVRDAIGISTLYNIPREGIVIRPLEEHTEFKVGEGLVHGRVSFKAINPEFLLKFKDA